MVSTPIFGDKSHVVRDQLRHLVAEVTKRFKLYLVPGVDTATPEGLLIFVVALSQSEALTEVAKQVAIKKDDPQLATQFSESGPIVTYLKKRLAKLEDAATVKRLLRQVAGMQTENKQRRAAEAAYRRKFAPAAQFSETAKRKVKLSKAEEAEQIYQEGQRGRWRSRPLGAVTA